MQKLRCIRANRSSRFLVIGIAQFTRIDRKCNQVVPWSLHTFPENFMQIGPAVSPEYKTSQTTDDRQTDRQTTYCTKGATDSTVGQKPRYGKVPTRCSNSISPITLPPDLAALLAGAVRGKIFGGPGPSSFGRQQRLSEI